MWGYGVSSAKILWRNLRTSRCTERPSAANALRVGWLKTERCGCIELSSEKPLLDEKAAKSRACSPMATAGRGDGEEAVVMIPNGMLASEKWDARGIGSQDVTGIMIDS